MSVPASYELADGYFIPRALAGLWQASSGHSNAIDDDPLVWLEQLFAAGWTTFDCADIYSGVEAHLGRLRDRLSPSERLQLKIHTKFVPDLALLPHIERHHVTATIERSLRRTGAETLDLVQFHWWDFGVPRYVETAGWLDELRREGKIRHLGLTNFDAARVSEIAASGLAIASNQVQYSLVDRRPQLALAAECQRHGIHLICYGSIAGGLLAERYVDQPEPQPPFDNRSLAKYALVVQEAGGWKPFQHLLRALATIAQRHGTSVSLVAARWVLDQPGVAAVVIGTRNAKRSRQHEELATLKLDASDRTTLEAAIIRLSPVPGAVYALERAPGRHAELMKTDLGGHARLGQRREVAS